MIFKEFSYQAGKVLLSIETSSSTGGLSIFNDQSLIIETMWGPEEAHSEILTEAFENILQKANLHSNLITEVLCSYGPGSFTGLRVGLNFAKSICYVNNIKLTLSPSFRSYFDIKDKSIHGDSKHIVLINAFKNQVFCGQYEFTDTSLNSSFSSKEIIFPKTKTPELIEDHFTNEKLIFGYGDGFSIYRESFSDTFNSKIKFPSVAPQNPSIRQAQFYFNYDHCLKLQKIDPLAAQPLYIKISEAEENLNRGQLKKHTQRKI